MKKVLIVAAHPDDEVLGCGATIAKHVTKGDEVRVLVMAEGITSRDKSRDTKSNKDKLSKLAVAANKAGEVLGVSRVILCNFPDNRMDSVDLLDIVKVVEEVVGDYSPEIVYTHHPADLNIDHRRVHDAVMTACRPEPFCKVKTILLFEVASSTGWGSSGHNSGFIPNWFVDISDVLSLKIKALEIYQEEMRNWPHARSISAIEHLARWRGASVGLEAAEAYVLGRNLW